MAFYGCYFTFDGVSCKDYEMMLYSFAGSGQDERVSLTSPGTAVEDRPSGRYSSYFYGVKRDRPLTFSVVFGVNTYRLDNNLPITRLDVSRISGWLNGDDRWKWLSIEQEDLAGIRFRCYVSNIEVITHDSEPWAFSCTFVCDGPYAYKNEEISVYTSPGNVLISTPESYNGRYYPDVIIDTTAQGDVSIENVTDGGREFLLTDIPSGTRITIDGQRRVMRAFTQLNGEYVPAPEVRPYGKFNFRFPALTAGINELSLTGSFGLTVITACPIDVGA